MSYNCKEMHDASDHLLERISAFHPYQLLHERVMETLDGVLDGACVGSYLDNF